MLAYRLTHRLLDRITRNAPCQIIHPPPAKSCILLQLNHSHFQQVENKGPVIQSGDVQSRAAVAEHQVLGAPPAVSHGHVTAIMSLSAGWAARVAGKYRRKKEPHRMERAEQPKPTESRAEISFTIRIWSSESVLQP